MGTFINTNMLILARESRGLNQAEAAEKVGIMPTTLSKIERNDLGVSDEVLNNIVTITKYPLSFFYQDGSIVPDNLNYRKREKVAQKLLTPIHARANIFRLHVQLLTNTLEIQAPLIPNIEVTGDKTPQLVAQKLRKAWKVDTAVIDNVTALLEKNGICIYSFNFGTERVDSRCLLTDDKYPVILYNSILFGDRQRFSLAYQLGHLVMHTSNGISLSRDVAHEANLFAAEFLMPEKEIRKDFKGDITVPLLAELKRKWKVSMIALLYRADDLGYLTPNQKRYLLQQFNELKIRRREPIELDVAIEQPKLIRQWLSELKKRKKLDVKGIAAELHLTTDEFIEIYN